MHTFSSSVTFAALALAAFTVAQPSSGAEPAATPPVAASISQPLVHLYSDAGGVSHFRDEVLSIGGGATGPAQLLLSQGAGARLLALNRGAKEDWHRPPGRIYLIALKGMSEVTAGDGEVRRFGPGSLLLMDDTTGKGHITRAVGSEDHVALTVTAPAP